MKLKAIASDFDGTILRPGEMTVREELFPVVHMMQQKGIDFIAASGRQYGNLRRVMKPVAEEISYVCENGALVVCRGEIIYKSVIERELALGLLEDLQYIPETDIAVSGEDTCYISADNREYVNHIKKRLGNTATIINDYAAIKRDMIKISIRWKTGIPEEDKMRFGQKYGDRLQIVDGGNGWLDFTNKGTDKGSALCILAEREGYGLQDIISIGDSENDISMLSRTGASYAMHTASEEIKRAAGNISYDAVETMKNIVEAL